MEATFLSQPHVATARVYLGTLLLRDGVLTPERLEEALAEKEETGRRLGEILVARRWATSRAIARALAEQHGLEFVDLALTEVDTAAASLLPEKFARRHQQG